MHTNSLLSLHNSAKKVEKGPTVVESTLNQNREYFKTAMQIIYYRNIIFTSSEFEKRIVIQFHFNLSTILLSNFFLYREFERRVLFQFQFNLSTKLATVNSLGFFRNRSQLVKVRLIEPNQARKCDPQLENSKY